jgi:virginiamycin B lyase
MKISRLAALPLVALLLVAAMIPAQAAVVGRMIVPLPLGAPHSPVAGPDGNVWFVQYTGYVGRVTPTGVVTEWPLTAQPRYLTNGPDGKLWFTVGDGVASITTSGAITNYALPTGSRPFGIATGPDGRIWIAETGSGRLAALNPVNGVVKTYLVPVALHNDPVDVVSGPDGNVWFVSYGRAPGRVASMTPSGQIVINAELRLGSLPPAQIFVGPDRTIWVPMGNIVHRVALDGTVDGTTTYPISATTLQVALGLGGDVWYTEHTALHRVTSSTDTRVAGIAGGLGPYEVAVQANGNVWVDLDTSNAIARYRVT